MANKALSERVKAQKRRIANEKKMRDAVHAYRLEQDKAENLRRGARIIAKEFGIENQWRTIINRHNGGRSIREGHEDLQKLIPAEETVLVNFLNESAARGFPQTPRNLADFANMIRRNRLGAKCEDVGESWTGRFLDRHRDILQTHWSKPLDTQRARAMNPEAKKKWFELVEEFVVKLGIKPENLYGMDETGCPPSDQGTERVIGERGAKTQHAQGGADRENVTALVTICADGTVLRPTIIFKAKNFRSSWGNDNVLGAS